MGGAFRWGKTMSAYRKWSHIFNKYLPVEIQTDQSSLSAVAYVRDVIAFAHENNLHGSAWYKKVMVTATGPNTIRIKTRQTHEQIQSYPTKGTFDLLTMQQEGTLKIGFKFNCSDTLTEVRDILSSFNLDCIDCGSNLFEICEVTKDEV